MYYKEIRWLEELVKQIDDGFYTGKANPARAYKTLAGAYFAVRYPASILPKSVSDRYRPNIETKHYIHLLKQ